MKPGRHALIWVVVCIGAASASCGLWAAEAGGEPSGGASLEDVAASPEELLRAMAERAGQHRYQGVRQSVGEWPPGGGRVRLFRDGTDRLRVEVLGEGDQPVRVMLRVGEQGWFWSAREPSGWRERPGHGGPPPGPWQHLDLLLSNYRVELLGREEMLGRPVAALRLSGRREHRPTALLWIDLETYLDVKLEKFSPSGKRSLAYEFVELSFPDQIEEAVFAPPTEIRHAPRDQRRPFPGHGFERFADVAELVRAVEGPVVVPRVLPAGFAETDISLVPRMAVVRMGYSDGLSEISLYEDPRARERGPDGPGSDRAPGGDAPKRGRSWRSSRDRGPRGEHEPGEAEEPSRHGERGGGPRPPRGPSESERLEWEGVTLYVARMRGVTVVRRTLVVGDPPVEVRTTVVGEVDEDELKAMSVSLAEHRASRTESEIGGGAVEESYANEEERR